MYKSPFMSKSKHQCHVSSAATDAQRHSRVRAVLDSSLNKFSRTYGHCAIFLLAGVAFVARTAVHFIALYSPFLGENVIICSFLTSPISLPGGMVFILVSRDTDFCIKLCQYQMGLTPSPCGP